MGAQPIQDERTDADLVDAANTGDPAAFAALYRRYRDWAAQLAFRFTADRDEALDVTQDTFLYLLRKFPGFTLTAQLKTFLYPVVRHLALERKRKRRRAMGGDDVLNKFPAPAAGKPGSDDLHAALSVLPAPQREVVLMRFVDDLSLQEIAEALAIPLGTVKSRLHHALQTLREDDRAKKYFQA